MFWISLIYGLYLVAYKKEGTRSLSNDKVSCLSVFNQSVECLFFFRCKIHSCFFLATPEIAEET